MVGEQFVYCHPSLSLFSVLSLQDTAACLGRVECHRVFNLFDALNTVSALAVRREGSSVSGTMNAMLENLSSLCAWLIFVPSPCPAQDVLMDDLKLIVVDSVYDIAAPILGDREAEGAWTHVSVYSN